MLFIHWIHFYKKWLHISPHFHILPLTHAIFPPPFGFNNALSSQIEGIFAFRIAITHVQRDDMKKSFLKLYVYNNKNGLLRLYLYTFASFNRYSFLWLNLCRVINIHPSTCHLETKRTDRCLREMKKYMLCMGQHSLNKQIPQPIKNYWLTPEVEEIGQIVRMLERKPERYVTNSIQQGSCGLCFIPTEKRWNFLPPCVCWQLSRVEWPCLWDKGQNCSMVFLYCSLKTYFATPEVWKHVQ